jgi:hypothetical protein
VLSGNWPVMRVYSSGFLNTAGKQQLFGRSGLSFDCDKNRKNFSLRMWNVNMMQIYWCNITS